MSKKGERLNIVLEYGGARHHFSDLLSMLHDSVPPMREPLLADLTISVLSGAWKDKSNLAARLRELAEERGGNTEYRERIDLMRMILDVAAIENQERQTSALLALACMMQTKAEGDCGC